MLSQLRELGLFQLAYVANTIRSTHLADGLYSA